MPFLLGYVISYLKNNKEKTDDIWTKYFRECVIQCNKMALSELRDIFTNEYKKNKFDVTTLNANQLIALVKDELLIYIIERWNAIDENNHIADFIYIAQNITIGESVCIKAYEKISSILGDLRGASKDDLLNKIAIINKITEPMIVSGAIEPITNLYNLITGTRAMNSTSNPYNRQTTKQVRLLEECVNIDEVNVLARFVVTTYKVTQGRINGSSELEILRIKDESTILNNILWLKSKWTDSLYPLASHLIKYSIYSNDELMNIYQSHFLEQYNEAPILKEEELKTKLDDMLQYAISNKDNKMFNWLNNISSKNNRIKTILISIISARPIGEIQSLPTELMDLAINSVDENNIESYRKYTDFLICLATSGSTAQKQYLVKLIVKMIDEKDDIQKVVSIIKSYKLLAKSYGDRIISTLNCIIEDNSDTTIVNMCSDAIEHLISINKSAGKAKKQRSA